jgi:hypothetical protein
MRTELGYYTVNGVKFTNKVSAILEAQLSNAEIEWHFFDELFNKVNWLDEPLTPLSELYRLRALQIREAYDYIVIRCSGGADSNNVLYSFLRNGIHVDEVLAEAPMSGLSNWDFNTKDTRAVNLASEFKYAQMPLLHEIATNYPRVKVTLRDAFNDMREFKTDDFVVDCQDIINPFTRVQSKLDELHHLNDLAESGKRIAIVSGTDKPVLSVMPDGTFFNVFSDQPVNVPKPPFKKNDYPNVDRVLFYWSHDMPEVVVKMCHVVAREIVKPENFRVFKAMQDLPKRYLSPAGNISQDNMLDYILHKNLAGYDKNESNKYQPFSVYERGIVPFIYPNTYRPDIFQADKIDPTESFFSSNHEWFRILHRDMKAVQIMESDFRHFYKSLSPKYLNNKRTGFKNYMKLFKIGTLNQFKGIIK